MAPHGILIGGRGKWLSPIYRLPLAIGMLIASLPANACTYPPPSLKHANETAEQYQARIDAEFKQNLLDGQKAMQARFFADAEQVYFARIVKSEEVASSANPYGRQTSLKPIEAIKGTLPAEVAILKTSGMTSCGPGNDGSATWGNVGDLVVVFVGKLYGPKKIFTFGLLAKDVTDEALAAHVTNFQVQNYRIYPPRDTK